METLYGAMCQYKIYTCVNIYGGNFGIIFAEDLVLIAIAWMFPCSRSRKRDSTEASVLQTLYHGSRRIYRQSSRGLPLLLRVTEERSIQDSGVTGVAEEGSAVKCRHH